MAQPDEPQARPVPPRLDAPPEAWEPLHRLARLTLRPLDRFLQIQAASGIVLLVAAALALWFANSQWQHAYHAFWRSPVGIRVGDFAFERSLEWVVNDGLMVIFFFVVGMEIRREIEYGELSEWRRAVVPAVAAMGGVMMPATLYLWIAGTPATHSGWGVPMATDIAFAVGVLTLLGKRVPAALRVLLLTIAVIDDLIAIVVIALFYASGIEVFGLFVAACGLAGVWMMQRVGVRAKLAYVLPALVVWAGVYNAGVHPTIAGVLIGFMTPVRAWFGPDGLLYGMRQELETLSAKLKSPSSSLDVHAISPALKRMEFARREALSPAESLIEGLHPWVAFVIMPLFALANAGVSLSGAALNQDAWRVIAGVSVGLVAGKPLGMLLVTGLVVRAGIGKLPSGLGARHVLVLGIVAGIGFTMALFVAQLAFSDAELLAAAKIGVLLASCVAAVTSFVAGRWLLRPCGPHVVVAQSADEAESSTEL
jgi:NhaA family Na+:H+ antiporter